MAAELASQPETWARAAELRDEQARLPAARRARRGRRLRHLLVHGAVVRVAARGRRAGRDRRVRRLRGLRRPRLRRASSRSPAPAPRPRCSSSSSGCAAACAPSASSATPTSPARRARRRGRDAAVRRRAVGRADPLRHHRARAASAPRSARTSTAPSPTPGAPSPSDARPARSSTPSSSPSSAAAGPSGSPTRPRSRCARPSQSWTESYPAMEYRHGPICDRRARPRHVALRRARPRASPTRSPPPGRASRPATSTRWPSSCGPSGVALARARRAGPRPRPAAQPHPLRHPRRLMDEQPTPGRRDSALRTRRGGPGLRRRRHRHEIRRLDRRGRVLGLRRTPTPRTASDPAERGHQLARRARRGSSRRPVPGRPAGGRRSERAGLVDERARPRHLRVQPRLARRADFASSPNGHPRPAGRLRPRRARSELGRTPAWRRAAATATSSCSSSAPESPARSCSAGGPTPAAGSRARSGHALSDRRGRALRVRRDRDASRQSPRPARSRGATARRPGSPCRGAGEVLAAAAAGDADAARVWDDALARSPSSSRGSWRSSRPRPLSSAADSPKPGRRSSNPLATRLDALLSFHRRPRTGARQPRRRRRPPWHGARRPRPRRRRWTSQGVTRDPHRHARIPRSTSRGTSTRSPRARRTARRPGTARAGGKGLNVARVLHGQGHDVLALATAGGSTGAEFEAELEASGIPHRLIRVACAHPAQRSRSSTTRAAKRTVLNEYGARPRARRGARPSPRRPEARTHGTCRRDLRKPAAGLRAGRRSAHLVGRLVAGGVPVVVDTSGAGIARRRPRRRPRTEAEPRGARRPRPATPTRSTAPARSSISGARLVVVSLGADGLVVIGRHGVARCAHGCPGCCTATRPGPATRPSPRSRSLSPPATTSGRTRMPRPGPASSSPAAPPPGRRAPCSCRSPGELSPDHAALAAEVVVTTIDEDRR